MLPLSLPTALFLLSDSDFFRLRRLLVLLNYENAESRASLEARDFLLAHWVISAYNGDKRGEGTP